MLIASTLGAITLNCSLLIYLFLYLPQLIHNHNPHQIKGLSSGMHYVLLLAYILDLFYGFSRHLQWQYKTVSIVSISLLLFQHVQISHYLRAGGKWLRLSINFFLFLLIIYSLYSFFIIHQGVVSPVTTEIFGYASRLCFIFYTIPQILKNRALKSGGAISPLFIYLNMTLSIMDAISSWCLNWGWPNKLGAPVMLMLMTILWLQYKRYRKLTN